MRLIDADALIKRLEGTIVTSDLFGMGVQTGIGCAIDEIKMTNPAPVRQEVHAAWVQVSSQPSFFECSNCGFQEAYAKTEFNYCPHCGATMDLDAKGE
jgi:hypothetical protein